MKRLIDSVESSIKTKNWYAALIVVLTLPDIAGKIDNPRANSGKRYADWFNKYVGDRYRSEIGPDKTEHVFLSGNDCYALRCSFLHEGKSDITHQRAREILENFEFVAPPKGTILHCNQTNNRLQLQVDIFCFDIIGGLKKWIEEISKDFEKLSTLNNLVTIIEIKLV